MKSLQNIIISSTRQPREDLLQIVTGSGAKLHWVESSGDSGAEIRLLGYQCISFTNVLLILLSGADSPESPGRQMESTLILTTKVKTCCAL